MRSYRFGGVILVLAMGLGLGIAAPVDFMRVDPLVQQEVDRLVRQLGSTAFTEREAATQKLEAIGAPALEALEKAMDSPDLEVRRRAAALVRTIERRVEAEQLLQPTRLRLRYQDKSLPEIVADLRERTKYDIVLKPNAEHFAQRRVTLETPELSFWEALDQLCAKAGITHQISAGRTVQPHLHAMRVDQFGLPMPVPPVANVDSDQIVLVDGQPPALRTFYAGALRIRISPTDAKTPGEAALALEVAQEPKVKWHGLVDLLLDKVVDDKSQALTFVGDDSGPFASKAEETVFMQGAGGPVVVIQGPQGRMVIRGNVVIDGHPGAIPWGDTRPVRRLRLKLPENPGKTIKLLKGTAIARVQTPVQPLVRVEDITQAEGKTFPGKEGAQLKINKVTKQANGVVIIQLHALMPPTAISGVNIVRVQGRRGSVQPFQGAFTLLDAREDPDDWQRGSEEAPKDKLTYSLIIYRPLGFNEDGAQEVQLMFRPRKEGAVPKGFVYAAARLTTLEVPFEIKDVPLP